MASTVNGLPCGFCGKIVCQYLCSGCGCRFTERNFVFDDKLPSSRESESKEDAWEAGEGTSGKFDEDDGQVQAILSTRWGWFLGRRMYELRLPSMNTDDPKFKNPAPTPSSKPEATTADFYDARNLCGLWRLLDRDQAPKDFDDTVAMIKAAGFVIPREVFEHEKQNGDYDFQKKVESLPPIRELA